MAKLQKLLDENIDIKHENFKAIEINGNEIYIDHASLALQEQGTLGITLPIAETDVFFYYICSNCLEIHVESKRYLNADNRIGNNVCKKYKTLTLPVRYGIAKNELAFEEATEMKLLEEWQYMNDFEKRYRKKIK